MKQIGAALAVVAIFLLPPAARAQQASLNCPSEDGRWGAAAIQAAIPDVVGQCLPSQPNATQVSTTRGLFAYQGGWQFTDGYWTYTLPRLGFSGGEPGPNGTIRRLNTEAWQGATPAVSGPAAQPAGPVYAPKWANGDGNPANVAGVARALLCQFMPADFCDLTRTNPIYFAALNGATDGGGFTNGVILSRGLTTSGALAAKNPIYLDQRFLTAPLDQTASVLIHESRHIYDAELAHAFMASFEVQRECLLSEQNALIDQARFWEWLYPGATYPQRDAFDAWAAQNAQAYVLQGTINPTSC